MPAELTVTQMLALHAAGKIVLDIGASGRIPRMEYEAGTTWRRPLRHALAEVSRELARERFTKGRPQCRTAK